MTAASVGKPAGTDGDGDGAGCRVTLQAPWRPDQKLADAAVNAVRVREVDPPPGEPAIEWLLLTSLAVDTFAPAVTAIEYYTCRWEIEVFFRVLKSGCTVESLQLETVERFTTAWPCI